jgi:hypothetical protein
VVNEAEAERRDRVLRAYFAGRDWDGAGEFRLKREFVERSRQLLPELPYVVDDEWEVSPGHAQAGKGDLVITDGRGIFAVVEVKLIQGGVFGGSSRNRRGTQRKKRRKVEQQAVIYADVLRRRLPGAALVRAFIWTNEGGLVEVESHGPLLES